MSKHFIPTLVVFLFALLPATAQAQLYNTYVTRDGPGTTCNYSQPCASLSQAHSYVADGGTITCLSNVASDGFMTITKGVTVDCKLGGAAANIAAITINAPGKTVVLRNLAVSPTGTSYLPIDIVAASSVILENVVVDRAANTGIRDLRAGPAKLAIKDSTIAMLSGPGIVIAPASGNIFATLENVTARDSAYGLAVGARARVMIVKSSFTGNGTAGVSADPGAIIEIEESLTAGNATGVVASAGSTVSISNSRINSNNTGISGATTSYGNNKFFANAVGDGTPPTPASLR